MKETFDARDPFLVFLQLVKGEYRESPGLVLTREQIARLWSMDSPTCDAVLAVLVDRRVLRQTNGGAYVRADAGSEQVSTHNHPVRQRHFE